MFISASWRLAVTTCRAVSAHNNETRRRAEAARIAREERRAPRATMPRRIRLQPASIGLALAVIATVVPVVSATNGQQAALTPGARFHGSGATAGAWLVRFRDDVTDADATRA